MAESICSSPRLNLIDKALEILSICLELDPDYKRAKKFQEEILSNQGLPPS